MIWYLSFADNGWLGACIVEGASEMDACRQAHKLSINPGGEVLCGNLTTINAVPPERFHNRLMNKEDLAEMDKVMGGTGELGIVQS